MYSSFVDMQTPLSADTDFTKVQLIKKTLVTTDHSTCKRTGNHSKKNEYRREGVCRNSTGLGWLLFSSVHPAHLFPCVPTFVGQFVWSSYSAKSFCIESDRMQKHKDQALIFKNFVLGSWCCYLHIVNFVVYLLFERSLSSKCT